MITHDDPRLTAYALGELKGQEWETIHAWVQASPEALAWVAQIREMEELLKTSLKTETRLELTEAQKQRILDEEPPSPSPARLQARRHHGWWFAGLGTASLAAAALVVLVVVPQHQAKQHAMQEEAKRPNESKALELQSLAREQWMSDQRAQQLKYEGAQSTDSQTREMIQKQLEMLELERDSRLRRMVQQEGLAGHQGIPGGSAPFHTESYDPVKENSFLRVANEPLSTFSIDVDTASYSNIRRFLTAGQRVPTGAVRIEEMVNYFPYAYPPPTDGSPFSASMEAAACPWNPAHRLLRVALKGRELRASQRPSANLVFLIDVSGSMQAPDKLPLVKNALAQLARQLSGRDKVTIVVYAGAAGMVLPPTSGADVQTILAALDRLEAGGSTHGSEGIQLAYEMASRQFIRGGVNRVILCTDGDFNVGVTSQSELVDLIQAKAKSGVFLSVLGFGTGNYKDSTLQKLADEGNGNAAYIDTPMEARKVLVEQLQGTLVTIAKDVKVQVEFNPSHVEAYRLIGYEKRRLRNEEFNDDRKDAGEIGAGHTVTAFYEVVPKGRAIDISPVDPLKYQHPSRPAGDSPEWLTLKVRYKQPEGTQSSLQTFTYQDRGGNFASASTDFRFAASVAGFGMLLQKSKHIGNLDMDRIHAMAESAKGADPQGYRQEFLTLIQRAKDISSRVPPSPPQ